MQIDHIGYAVKKIESGRAALEALGFRFGATIEDAARNVALAFGELDGYRVELVAPLTPDSLVSGLLKTAGPTPYHICYTTPDLDATVRELVSKRFKVIVPPTPAVAFGGRRVVFLYSLAIGTLELVEQAQ